MGLEYYILLLEKAFYEEHKLLLCREAICNASKRLPCDCLTGLGMNYWGYVIKNCYRVDVDNILDIKDNVCCVLTKYDDKQMVPVIFDQNDTCPYLFPAKICKKKYVSRDKIYINENAFVDYERMTRYISEKEITEYKPIELEPMLDFLAYFIIAVRTQPIKEESRVLFALMLFFFPNRTMTLVLEYVHNLRARGDEIEYIREFMEKYDSFLTSLSSCDVYGFPSRFSTDFEELTGVYVGEWIQTIIDRREYKEFCEATLFAACNRNIEERNRRNSRYKKVMSACKEH